MTDRYEKNAMTLDRPDWHVMPRDDLREHEASGSCWCRPKLDDEGSEPIWIHNSLDGREAFETGERLPS